jgi:O-antigen/teichoic acid export membrane protein
MKILKSILNKKDVRSNIVLKNAFLSFFVKGLSIAVNFLTIPLVLTFLDQTQYGIWLTLTAILGWFSLFDLGFGNGLRNHLTTSITNNKMDEGRIYVSTTYVALALVFGTLIVVFTCVHPFINWRVIFNAPNYMNSDINRAVLFAMCFLFVQFVLRLITTVLLAFQKSATAEFINTIVQVMILVGLFCLKIMNFNSITSVAIVYSLTPVLVFLFTSLYFFYNKYPEIRPSFRLYNRGYVNRLLKLGINFFIIQIAALVLYASDNFIITQLFSPADVTVYNVSYKYFSIAAILFNIILAPFWSMVTQAYAQGDLEWIKKSIKRLLILWLFICIASVLQLIVSNPIYNLWTNNKVIVPFSLSLVICFYSMATTYGTIFSSFINGVGKVRVQLILSVLGVLINIPLAIFFVKHLKLGIMGVPLATTLTVILASIVITIQYNKLIKLNAEGVWNR